MIEELMKELNRLTTKEKYIYRFVNMLDSILDAYKRGNETHLDVLMKNSERLIEEYRKIILYNNDNEEVLR